MCVWPEAFDACAGDVILTASNRTDAPCPLLKPAYAKHMHGHYI
jgi:hypothetical protein